MIPTVTFKFSNPVISGDKFLLDVVAKCDQPGKQIFGINLRYFYDGGLFKSLKASVAFVAFKGGYGLGWGLGLVPKQGNAASRGLFNTTGPAVEVNTSVGLLNPGASPVILDDWNVLFTIATDLKAMPAGPFCPSFIWDKKYNPANGGFLPGSNGLTVVLKAEPGTRNEAGQLMESQPCIVHVEQFNWDYAGDRIKPPYGLPAPCQ